MAEKYFSENGTLEERVDMTRVRPVSALLASINFDISDDNPDFLKQQESIFDNPNFQNTLRYFRKLKPDLSPESLEILIKSNCRRTIKFRHAGSQDISNFGLTGKN